MESLEVRELKINTTRTPIGLDTLPPRMSWQLRSSRRGVRQSAYRVVVATRRELIEIAPDVWDSGRVHSSACTDVAYDGPTPRSRTRYWWAVQVWDHPGASSALSEPSYWEMGLLDEDDWRAEWLDAETSAQRDDRTAGFAWAKDPLGRVHLTYRTRFELASPIIVGRVFAAGSVGEICRIAIDGEPLRSTDDRWLTADVGQLDAGRHEIRVEVAGMESPRGSTSPHIALSAFFQDSSGIRHRFVPTARDWTVESDGGPSVPAENSDVSSVPWPAQPAVHLRRTFTIDLAPVSARLYVTALGAYGARINGSPAAANRLAPEISQYAARLYYQTYDVTGLLETGENVLAITVADGWYASHDSRFEWAPAPRKLLAQLEVVTADGATKVVCTDGSWRVAEGPIRRSELKGSELIDHRCTLDGWDRRELDRKSVV